MTKKVGIILHKGIRDLVGCQFYTWKVLKDSGNRTHSGAVIWLCECVNCHEQSEFISTHLVDGKIRHCSCSPLSKKRNKVHQDDRFGRWVVLSSTDEYKPLLTKHLCLCDCGVEKWVLGANLVSGKSTSCGCIRIEELHSRKGRSYARKSRLGEEHGDFTIIENREPEPKKPTEYLAVCENDHAVILSDWNIRKESGLTCWCSEENPIKRNRLKNGYTLQKVADMLGITKESVRLVESKPREVGKQTIVSVADIVGLTAEETSDYIKEYKPIIR